MEQGNKSPALFLKKFKKGLDYWLAILYDIGVGLIKQITQGADK